MKKAVIYVFSGTGNTRLVADLYKKNLFEYETTIYDVRMKKVSENSSKFEFLPFPSPEEFGLVGFGHPVYGFNIPKPFDDFINLLPKLKNPKKAFVFKTSGEGLYMNEFSSQITKMVHDGLKNLKTEKVKISVGAILGSNIMTQTGPSIGLKIRPVGNATVNFFTEFESGGINQTKYKVYMQVVGKAKPVIPFVSETYEVVTTVPVAETVIVGNVPQTYLSLPLK